jgi:hypothetical protein
MNEKNQKPKTPIRTPEQRRYDQLRDQAKMFANDVIRYLEGNNVLSASQACKAIPKILRDMDKLSKLL